MFAFYKVIGLLLTPTLLLLGSWQSYAQDTLSVRGGIELDKAEVRWVSQWPLKDGKQKSMDMNGKIRKLIFGARNQTLTRPVSMVTNKQGNYWILDQQSSALFQVTEGQGKVPRFIEKKGYDLTSLVGICNFRPGEMLFTDTHLNKIFLINPEKKICEVLNDSLKLDKPTGIAYSAREHEIWVTETGKHRIVILTEGGELKRTIGSRGNAKGEFNFPTQLTIDKNGLIEIVDAMNFRVQVFNEQGEVVSVFGSNGDGSGYFASPKGIATDSYGNIYVADALFHVVQIFDVSGRFLYTFGAQGQGEGEFWMPSGVYIDDKDRIYVSDCYNSRIQVFQLIAGGKK
ncbi:MAG TPA: 6-bladed beta-propeller [Bacteroidia bacterium]|jgi:DNA-binding beta-propeller fold protein YncE|nr:6-bladed beta-propeller [Bacteroidia bacterium]